MRRFYFNRCFRIFRIFHVLKNMKNTGSGGSFWRLLYMGSTELNENGPHERG